MMEKSIVKNKFVMIGIFQEVQRIQSKGYISLYQIKGKRRELNIFLTETGKEYAHLLLKDLYSKEEVVYSHIDQPESILQILQNLVQTMKSITNGGNE